MRTWIPVWLKIPCCPLFLSRITTKNCTSCQMEQQIFAFSVLAWIDIYFTGRWIGRRGQNEWPPQSPNLTRCDFVMWACTKQKSTDQNQEYFININNKIETFCHGSCWLLEEKWRVWVSQIAEVCCKSWCLYWNSILNDRVLALKCCKNCRNIAFYSRDKDF